MASVPQTELTWTALQAWPEDGKRYELIDGVLHVSPSPNTRHQRVVMLIATELVLWTREHGGQVLAGPYDVYVHEREYVEPDVLYVHADRVTLFEERRLPAPPDLVVEVTSPGNRRVDLRAKRDLYARFGVPEYWVVDLQEERVLVHRQGALDAPVERRRGEDLDCVRAPGFTLAVSTVLDA
jgi:Uma2 family endonuclease